MLSQSQLPRDTRVGESRELAINCPACGARGTQAIAYDWHEQYKLVIRHQTTSVKCLNCGRTLYSQWSVAELEGHSAEELEPVLTWRTSLISRIFALLAILLCIFPMLGLGMAMLSVLCNLRSRGWPRTLSLTALAMSVLTTIAIVLLFALT